MKPPIKKIFYGKIQGALWEGDYQGKPTYSMSFQKSYKKGDKWEHTNFFTMVDLRDLYILIGSILDKQVKEAKNNNVSKEKSNNTSNERSTTFETKSFNPKDVDLDQNFDNEFSSDSNVPF
jgi:hypothetical protein